MPLNPDEVAFLKSKGYSDADMASLDAPAPQPTPSTSPAPTNAKAAGPSLAPDEVAFLRQKGYSPAEIASFGAPAASSASGEAPQPSVLSEIGATAGKLANYIPGVSDIKSIYGQTFGNDPIESAGQNFLHGISLGGLAAGPALEAVEAGSVLAPEAIQAAKASLGAALGSNAAAGLAAKAGGGGVAQTLAGLSGGGFGGALGEGLTPEIAPPAKLSPAAQALQDAGGKLTPAMKGNGFTGTLAKAADYSARTNPLTSWLFNGADTANQEAVNNIAKAHFGNDVLDPQIGQNAGNGLRQQLENLASKRSDEYKPALEAIKAGGSVKSSDLLGAAQQAAQDNNLGNKTTDAFMKALQTELKGRTNAYSMDKALTNVRDTFQRELNSDILPGQTQHDFGTLMGAVKDKFYQSLGPLGEQLRAAKGDYAQASQALEPLADALNTRNLAPEKVGSTLLNKGSGAIKGLLDYADPATQASIQNELSRSILSDSIGKDGGISADRLKTALATKYRGIVPMLGDAGIKLQGLADSMGTARVGNLGDINPSGSGNAIAKNLNWAGLAGSAGMALRGDSTPLSLLALKTLLDGGYALGGNAIGAGADAASRSISTAFPYAQIGRQAGAGAAASAALNGAMGTGNAIAQNNKLAQAKALAGMFSGGGR